MIQQIDRRRLREISAHTRRLGVKRFLQSMGYERSAELPLIASRLEPLFEEGLTYLDIGSGDAVFPTYVLLNSNWDVTCIDKHESIHQQHVHARKVMRTQEYAHRFHVLQQDFLHAELPPASFDVITNISVIEHFEGSADSVAMEKSARLLRPGGIYILTTPVNERFFNEFSVHANVYGEKYASKPVFFQRHYDTATLASRIIEPSGLQERERLYFGEYGFQFFERFMDVPWPWKPVKLFYQWATPVFSRRFLTYRDYPVSRSDMHMYTASGVFLAFAKDR